VSGAVADAERFHTLAFSPAATRLLVIADPMMPAPITATAIPASPLLNPAMTAPFLVCSLPSTRSHDWVQLGAAPAWLHCG
jgi:hypothetical protein